MNQYHKQLVSKKELKTVCGIPYSPQHIQRLETVGQFPKRVQLGRNRAAILKVAAGLIFGIPKSLEK